MASKSTKGEILAKFFDDGEYTALFADGAVSAASGYAAGQQAYAVFQNGEAVSVKDVVASLRHKPPCHNGIEKPRRSQLRGFLRATDRKSVV